MRHGVDLSIRSDQGRLQEHAALQALGIAHRRHRHVQASATLHESPNVGGDHHRSDVLGLEGGRGHIDPKSLQHVGDALNGENQVLVAVPGQSHDQSVAGQLVIASAGEHRQVFNARTGLGSRRSH